MISLKRGQPRRENRELRPIDANEGLPGAFKVLRLVKNESWGTINKPEGNKTQVSLLIYRQDKHTYIYLYPYSVFVYALISGSQFAAPFCTRLKWWVLFYFYSFWNFFFRFFRFFLFVFLIFVFLLLSSRLLTICTEIEFKLEVFNPSVR